MDRHGSRVREGHTGLSLETGVQPRDRALVTEIAVQIPGAVDIPGCRRTEDGQSGSLNRAAGPVQLVGDRKLGITPQRVRLEMDSLQRSVPEGLTR